MNISRAASWWNAPAASGWERPSPPSSTARFRRRPSKAAWPEFRGEREQEGRACNTTSASRSISRSLWKQRRLRPAVQQPETPATPAAQAAAPETPGAAGSAGSARNPGDDRAGAGGGAGSTHPRQSLVSQRQFHVWPSMPSKASDSTYIEQEVSTTSGLRRFRLCPSRSFSLNQSGVRDRPELS